jgi:hypothetical protein
MKFVYIFHLLHNILERPAFSTDGRHSVVRRVPVQSAHLRAQMH